MSPYLPKHDLTEDGRADPELLCYPGLSATGDRWFAKPSDLSDIVVSQFGVAVQHARCAVMDRSASLDHVTSVIDSGTGVQMGRVATWSIVAVMEGALANRQRAPYRDLQADLVCLPDTPTPVVDLAIPLLVDRSRPRPALIWTASIDVFPDALADRGSPRRLSDRLARHLTETAILAAWEDQKDDGARFAHALDGTLIGHRSYLRCHPPVVHSDAGAYCANCTTWGPM